MKTRHMMTFLLILVLLLTASCDMDHFLSGFDQQTPVIEDEPVQKPVFDKSAPEYLVASKALYTDSIVLSWGEVEGADYYEISRKASDSDVFETFPFDIIGTSYVDWEASYPSLVAKTRYTYRVRACSKALGFGDYSPEAAGSLLCPPSALDAAKGKNAEKIMLSWKADPDVDSYKIYRSRDLIFSSSDSFVAEVRSSSSGIQKYSYLIKDGESGVNLYFKVTAVGRNGCETDLDESSSAIGYSLVYGAPSVPENLAVTQGESINAQASPLSLTWDQDPAVSSYEIYRSAPGVSEQMVFPYGADKLEDLDGQKWRFTDKRGSRSIEEGVRYTYTVIPLTKDDSDSILKGEPASADGYLLSNPVPVLSLSSQPLGFKLTFSQSVGLDFSADRASHSDWYYTIVCKAGKSSSKEETISPEDKDVIEFFSPFDPSLPEDEQYTMFSVQLTNGDGMKTALSDAISVKAPCAPEGLSVSSNRFFSGLTANLEGVFPIRISWSKSEGVDHYVIERWNEDGSSKLDSVTVPGNVGSYDDSFQSAVPGQKYSYRIQAVDLLGRSSVFSDPVIGYGAITAKTLVRLWTCLAFKPWENADKLPTQFSNDFFDGIDLASYWRDGSINSRVKKGNGSSLNEQMEALGEEKQTCHEAHGAHAGAVGSASISDFGFCRYYAKTEGIGGFISFTYEDFGESSFLYSEKGYFEMHVNTSGTGTAQGLSFTISGMYPAVIGNESIRVENKAFVGNYSVKMADGQGTVSVSSSL